ncbi:MAG: hypothetical protein HY880_00050, partial [Deltaproteobacteria bacterium]|nr:hypothetical protein [Deltaproteobacteria bacterium]
DVLRTRCQKIIEEKTEVYNPLAQGDSTRLLALVGPTGVGKTLTIAKLMAKLRTKWKAKIGLISLDSARPGVNESLKSCASTYGVEIDTPASKEEFSSTLWRHKDKDVVFIDTPGKNPSDAKGIAALKHILGAGVPIKTGLVLSCATRDDTQLDVCRGFGALAPNYLVFTKIDEVRRFGSMLNCSVYAKRPIGFLCNGQAIPRDIDVATRATVGGLIMGGKGQ